MFVEFKRVFLPDGRLYARGIYPSKVTAADLPDTFETLLVSGDREYGDVYAPFFLLSVSLFSLYTMQNTHIKIA